MKTKFRNDSILGHVGKRAFLLLLLILILGAVGPVRGEVIAAWSKTNATLASSDYLAYTNHPNLNAPATMNWKPRFYTYNDNNWFYIEPWFNSNVATVVNGVTNWFTGRKTLFAGISATNQFWFRSTNHPLLTISNYIEFAFTAKPGYKVVVTQMLHRMQNDERRLLFHLRSDADGYTDEMFEKTTAPIRDGAIIRMEMTTNQLQWTTNVFQLYTNIISSRVATDYDRATVKMRLYGVNSSSQWVYAYWTNMGVHAHNPANSGAMILFEGRVEPLAHILPRRGALAGGNLVLITNAFDLATNTIGSGIDITNVTVGGKPVSALQGQGTNWVSFTMPPGDAPGSVDIAIYSTSKGENLLSSSYSYNPTGIIVSVSPTSGVAGTEVTITGENLGDGTDITNVTFGATSATVLSQSATHVVVTAPSGSGTVGVRIYSTSYGETYQPSAFTYTSAVPQSTITFDANGGTPTNAPITQDEGSAVTAPADPTRAGFTFGGWLPAVPALMPVDDLTCTAQWAVAKSDQTITFPAIASQPTNGLVGLAATAASGLPVSFVVASGPGAISGGTNLAFSGVGTVAIVASQAGDGDWNPASDVTNTVHVYALDQSEGPVAGGNSITITNGVLGGGSDITNVTVGGVAAVITGQGADWVTITLGEAGSTGVKDIVIQSTSKGGTTFANAYTYEATTEFYADASKADDAGNGVSWATAKKTIQAAVDLAGDGNTVWVTNGLYDVNGVKAPGGTLTNRLCITKAITVRSVNGPDVTIIKGASSGGALGPAAIRCAYLTNGAQLIGFTLTNGYTQLDGAGLENQCGGGAFLNGGGTIISCIVVSCSADTGGGIAVWPGTGTVTSCSILTNWAEQMAGGVMVRVNAKATITDCTIADNTSDMGGGLCNDGDTLVQNCTIENNEQYGGGSFGGGMLNSQGNLLVVNSTVSGNRSANIGGGLCDLATTFLLNTIIINNTADSSGDDIHCDWSSGTYGYYSWYNGVDGWVQAQANAPNVTTAYTGGDLSALADNGGFTKTMELSGSAPADGAGAFAYTNGVVGVYFLDNVATAHTLTNWGVNPSVAAGDKITVDQRGETREAPLSMGAYQVREPSAPDDQTITFPTIGNQLTTDTVGLSATADSGLTVSFNVLSGSASINGGTNLTFSGAGVVSIVASQVGDVNWSPAPDVTNTFNVTKAVASVTLSNLVQTYDGTAKSATASTDPEGLTVDITYNGSATAPTDVGSYAVTGAVADVMYQGEALGTLSIGPSGQTIDFPAIGDKVTTDQVGLAATASSGLAVSFAVASGPASIAGGTNLTFTGAGSVSIVASQVGDVNWNPAPDLTNTFNVLGVYTVTVASAFGTATPVPGDYVHIQGDVITNRVTSPDTFSTTQYVATGWSMTGHEPATGNDTELVFTVTNSAVLTWLWSTQYWLEIESVPDGSVNVSNGWHGAGSMAEIEAIPDAYFDFSHWSGDASGSDNPMILAMDASKSVSPFFVALYTTNHPTPQWWLAEHGITENFDGVVNDDPDGDDVPNWMEFIMDTDPTNAASVLAVSGMEPAYGTNCWEMVWTNDAPPYDVGTNIECEVIGQLITWPISTQRIYDVQSLNGLIGESWTGMPQMTNITPATPFITITNPINGDQIKFHRVTVRLPE